MQSTIWALVPTLMAIGVALFTKNVNVSLLAGIVLGAVLYAGINPFSIVSVIMEVMESRVAANFGVLVFVILLGVVVYLMNLSGATHTYAAWASKKLKTKKQTLLATMALGTIIFVDDYFNCLTVGTVMRPISDQNRISREKLAYIIDSTAAPVCILAPVSSWAAAVSSSLPDGSSIDGFHLFLKSIFCNYYPWFALFLMLASILLAFDFGKMRQYEEQAANGTYVYPKDTAQSEESSARGHVIDMLLPVLCLIVFSVVAMLYTGGFFSGEASFTYAFTHCDANLALSTGAIFTIVVMGILYLPRKIMTFTQFSDGLVEGFKNMVPTALILLFAWTLSGICGPDYLNAGGVIAHAVETYNVTLTFMPAVFFLIAMLLSLATGTAWGTFAMLLPIAVSVFSDTLTPLTVMTTAAILGGSVCGDHISPISDTTILSSAGSGCHHINHVSTQMQYGLAAAAVSFISYIAAGITENGWIGMGVGILAMAGVIWCSSTLRKNRLEKENEASLMLEEQ